jgi:hypothetical protein
MTEAQPHLVDTGCGHTISYRGRTLYSPQDPRGAAVRRVEKLELQPGTLVFVPSLGLGYGLAELLGKLPASCHILCIEADERLFKLGITQAQPLPKSSSLTIIRTADQQQAAATVQKLGPWRFRRVVPVHLCGGYQFHRRTYRLLLEAVEEEIRLFWQNKLTLVAMSELWLKNLFTNLRTLPAAGDIVDLATNRPILICGAGPSLEGSLEWIREVRHEVILMCVDTALPVLAEAALVPDWVFTLDAQLYTLQDFIPWRDSRIALLCDLTSNSLVLRLFQSIYFFSTRFHPLSLFDRLEAASLLPSSLPPRGSVGVSAAEAALHITSGPVLFSGLDFSYPKNQTHARSTPIHLGMLRGCTRLRPCGMAIFETLLARPRLWLHDKGGKRVLTDLVLHSYARQLRSVNAESSRIYDLSAEGLCVGARRVDTLAQLRALCSGAAVSAGADIRTGRAGLDRPGTTSRSGNRPRPTTGSLLRFCEREQELLSGAVQSIAESNQMTSAALSVLEYLLLSCPEVDPDRQLSPKNLARVHRLAGALRQCLARTRCALKADH